MSYIQAADGTRLYVEETGQGDAVIFAHEFGGDWRSWRSQVACFKDSFRCIRYCARGFFPSDVPADERCYGQDISTEDLLTIADAFGLRQFHLVGLSMGSFTSLLFALAHPERLISMTLAGCSSGPKGDVQRARYREDLTTEIALLDEHGGDGAARWFSGDKAYQRMPEKKPLAWEAYCDNLRAQSVVGSRNTLSTLHWSRPSIFERENDLRALRVPILLIFGDEDHHLIEPTNEFLASTLPFSKIRKLERTGHLVNIEEPEIFNRELEQHFREAGYGRDRSD